MRLVFDRHDLEDLLQLLLEHLCLTGRYCWRSKLTSTVASWRAALNEQDWRQRFEELALLLVLRQEPAPGAQLIAGPTVYIEGPRSPHADAFEEEAYGRLDALLRGLSRPRVA